MIGNENKNHNEYNMLGENFSKFKNITIQTFGDSESFFLK